DKIVGGWWLRDGVVGTITGGESFVFERRADGAPLADRVTALDDLGRRLVAEGRGTNLITWPGYPNLHAWFTHFEWTFDGLAAPGEEQEWIPLPHRRRFTRQVPLG
ncbi:MAG TPA: hypothetical protein VHL53_18975, partial [Acidimicrobiia bacterium]|nr:hypothetical protein [Acidimicrobiia bacterium]